MSRLFEARIGITRRQFLGLLAGLPVLLALGGRVRLGVAGAAASGILSADLVLGETELSTSGTRQDLRAVHGGLTLAGDRRGLYTSAVLRASMPFAAVGPHWDATVPLGAGLSVALRTSPDGREWGPWQQIGLDELGENRGEYFGRLAFVPYANVRHRYAQCRVDFAAAPSGESPTLRQLTLTFKDASSGPSAAAAAQAARQRALNVALLGARRPPLIARSLWGCPDGDASPRWPPEYAPVHHAIVHHTATTNSTLDWAQQVRIIWDYHARTQGWGDIGYNYLIDPQGNLYEGRAGGDEVAGAHALMFNHGSMGIALIGTYALAPPPAAAQETAANLIAWKFARRFVDPRAAGAITALRSCGTVSIPKPNLAGHRDLAGHSCTNPDPNNTLCPGDQLYDLLPDLRQKVFQAMKGVYITSIKFNAVALGPGQKLEVTVTVWNNTDETIATDNTRPSGYTYKEGENFGSKPEKGRFRLGLDYAGRPGPPEYPYRWGLGGDLAPGETRTVTGSVALSTERRTDYWVTLVQEWVGFGEPYGRTAIAYDVTPPTSKVQALPPKSPGRAITVSWEGTDATSGIASYDVQYKEGPQGVWQDWKIATPQRSAVFTGILGRTYYFRCRARDQAGNLSAYSPTGDTSTTLVQPLKALYFPFVRK